MQVAEIFTLFGLKMDRSWNQAESRVGGFIHNMDRSFRRFRNLFVGVGLFGTLKWVADASDSFEGMHSRLRLVAGSEEEVNTLFERMRGLARATRSDLGQTVNGFTKIAQSVQGMGLKLSNEDLISRLELINKVARRSGSSPTATKAAFEQFMQGIASNRLGGEEIRSVLEQLPTLADQIGKHLNKTRGQVRELSKDGKLVAKTVLEAFDPKYAAEINAEFAKIRPTIGDAATAFKNDLLVELGRLARDTDFIAAATAAFKALTVAVRVLANVIRGLFVGIKKLVNEALAGNDGATAILIGLAAAILAIVVPALVSMAVAAFTAVAPFVAIAAVVAAVAFGIIKLIKHAPQIKKAFADAINWIHGKFAALGDFIVSIPEMILDAFARLGDAIIDALGRAFDWVVEKASDAAGAIWGAIKDIPIIGRVAQWAEDKGAGATAPGIDQAMARATANAPMANVPASARGQDAGWGNRQVTVPMTVNINGVKDAQDAVQQFQGATENAMRHTMNDVGGD